MKHYSLLLDKKTITREKCYTSSKHVLRTWEISLGKKTMGRQACHQAWRRPSSTRQRPRPGSSVPEPWQSWHTRRRGRRCRTAGLSGICGKGFLPRRKQKGTWSQGTAVSFHWWCSSERRERQFLFIYGRAINIYSIWASNSFKEVYAVKKFFYKLPGRFQK